MAREDEMRQMRPLFKEEEDTEEEGEPGKSDDGKENEDEAKSDDKPGEKKVRFDTDVDNDEEQHFFTRVLKMMKHVEADTNRKSHTKLKNVDVSMVLDDQKSMTSR